LFKTGAVGKTYWAVVEGGPTEDEGTIDLSLGRRDETRGWWMRPDPAGQPAITRWKVLGRAEVRPTENAATAVPNTAARADQASSEARAADASPPTASAASGGEGAGGGGQTTTAGLPPGAAPPPPPPPPPLPPPRGGARRASGSEHGPHQVTWLALEPVTGRTHQLRVHCAALGFPIVGDSIYGTQASLRSLRKEDVARVGGPALHLHSREIVVPLYKNRAP